MPDKECPVCSTPLGFEFDIPFETFLQGFQGDQGADIDLNFSVADYQAGPCDYTGVVIFEGKGQTFRAQEP